MKVVNRATGVQIEADERVIERLAGQWVPVGGDKSAPKRATRRSAPKKDAPADTSGK